MSKVVLADTISGYNLTVINSNFDKIEAALNNDVLYRNNPDGEPNSMADPLDMNGQRIINLPVPGGLNDAARMQDVVDATAGITNAAAMPFSPTATISATNVQGAIAEADTENRALSAAITTNLADGTDVAKGDALIAVKRTETGTVATTQHKVNQDRSLSLYADLNAAGDGTTDDTTKVQAAIDSGASVISGGGRTYKITSELNWSTVGQEWKNVKFKFDGTNATRIGKITAADVSFRKVEFDGNSKQPKACLTYIASNAARPSFRKCKWKNLTGTGSGSNNLNHMYGLMISPYGVEDFLFDECRWENFAKYNDGTFFTAGVGLGATGAIFFLTEDFAEPDTAQTVFTGGEIRDCVIDNVQTILAASLSENDRVEFDDADGIRFYGSSVVDTWLNVKITNLKCRKVSKRGVKISSCRGVEIDTLLVDGRGMQYGMVTAVKLDNDCIVKKVRAIAGSSAKRFTTAYQMQGWERATLEHSNVDHCQTGYQVLVGLPNKNISDIIISKCRFEGVQLYGIYETFSSSNLTQDNLLIKDTKVVCTQTNSQGLALTNAVDNSAGWILDNVKVVNGGVKIEGKDVEIEKLHVKITSNTYAGINSTTGLIEIGSGKGIGGFTKINGLRVDTAGINTSYLTASRPYLVYMAADKLQATNLTIVVPEGLTVTYPHLEVYGDDSKIEGLDYYGPGTCRMGAIVASTRWSVNNATRWGNATCSTSFWTMAAASTNYAYTNIKDYRPTTAPTIVNTIATNGIAGPILTRSSNGTPGASGVAKTHDINTF